MCARRRATRNRIVHAALQIAELVDDIQPGRRGEPPASLGHYALSLEATVPTLLDDRHPAGDPDSPDRSRRPAPGWARRIFAKSFSRATLRFLRKGRSRRRSLGWWSPWSSAAGPRTPVASGQKRPRCGSATAPSWPVHLAPAAEPDRPCRPVRPLPTGPAVRRPVAEIAIVRSGLPVPRSAPATRRRRQ